MVRIVYILEGGMNFANIRDLIRFIEDKRSCLPVTMTSLREIQIRWVEICALPLCMGTEDLRKIKTVINIYKYIIEIDIGKSL